MDFRPGLGWMPPRNKRSLISSRGMAMTGGGRPGRHIGLPEGKTKEREGTEEGKEQGWGEGDRRKEDRKEEGERGGGRRLTGRVRI